MRAKHIDIRYLFLREKVLEKELKIEYCPTTEMVADMMTKPLATHSFEKLRRLINVMDIKLESGKVKSTDSTEQEGVLNDSVTALSAFSYEL